MSQLQRCQQRQWQAVTHTMLSALSLLLRHALSLFDLISFVWSIESCGDSLFFACTEVCFWHHSRPLFNIANESHPECCMTLGDTRHALSYRVVTGSIACLVTERKREVWFLTVTIFALFWIHCHEQESCSHAHSWLKQHLFGGPYDIPDYAWIILIERDRDEQRDENLTCFSGARSDSLTLTNCCARDWRDINKPTWGDISHCLKCVLVRFACPSLVARWHGTGKNGCASRFSLTFISKSPPHAVLIRL